ncbi:hypothetical protein [Luteolibacter marinus]|uniref:hypothetical protein n=1 Tax=Luteolibacter marinus TaxID=2776705 RepID=UPI001868A5C7|nr:hypothetical protein [Luteolibacter marinus]
MITRAVSAPLICLLALADLKQDELSRPLIAVLPYPRFTLLAFFNEFGDLRLLRTLQHRGQRRPTNLRHAASTTAAALELAEPEVFLFTINDQADPQLAADLQLVFPAASIREVDWSTTGLDTTASGCSGPEPLVSTLLATTPETPLAQSHTFTVLRGDGWAAQDFLPVAREQADVFPSKTEMKLLNAARFARLGFGCVTILALAWTTLGVVDMIRKPDWAFEAKNGEVAKQRLTFLTQERTRIDHWDNLLSDRSKAWASMELLPTLFPDNSGFLAKTFNHSAKADTKPGQARIGLTREWKIAGLAREGALERLATLNTRDGISSVFDQVAAITGNSSYLTDLPSRSLVVNVRTLENGSFRPGPIGEFSDLDESTYPFSFDLTITQRFESSDQMALISAKAP